MRNIANISEISKKSNKERVPNTKKLVAYIDRVKDVRNSYGKEGKLQNTRSITEGIKAPQNIENKEIEGDGNIPRDTRDNINLVLKSENISAPGRSKIAKGNEMKDLKTQLRATAQERRKRLDLLEANYKAEKEVVRKLMAKGYTERQIAAEMDVAVGTVRMYRRDIARDLGLAKSILNKL